MLLMFLSNGRVPVHVREALGWDLQEMLLNEGLERGEPLVEVGAYTLMPNHIHFVMQEIQNGGIARFMQKIFTGYTMYFNKKYERTGALFAGTFKSKHIADDRYFKRVVPYVLLNSIEIFEPNWKQGVGNIKHAETKLRTYPYSSLPDFMGEKRPENILVGNKLDELYDTKPALSELLVDAQAYYHEQSYLG